VTSGDSTFSATGNPIRDAARTASSAVRAASGTATGRPSECSIRLLSISVRTVRPLERADDITDETMESVTLVAYSRAEELFEPPAGCSGMPPRAALERIRAAAPAIAVWRDGMPPAASALRSPSGVYDMVLGINRATVRLS
ncbi:MAG: hypothetical protein ABSF85_18430, partial [Terriglobales bacterium]